jgi:hypothetical protein
VPYFRIYDLRSTYATRLSAGGVADEWVTQLLRQGGAKVFKKYSPMKLQMKREALKKLNRKANEGQAGFTRRDQTDEILSRFCHGRSCFPRFGQAGQFRKFRKRFRIKRGFLSGA